MHFSRHYVIDRVVECVSPYIVPVWFYELDFAKHNFKNLYAYGIVAMTTLYVYTMCINNNMTNKLLSHELADVESCHFELFISFIGSMPNYTEEPCNVFERFSAMFLHNSLQLKSKQQHEQSNR